MNESRARPLVGQTQNRLAAGGALGGRPAGSRLTADTDGWLFGSSGTKRTKRVSLKVRDNARLLEHFHCIVYLFYIPLKFFQLHQLMFYINLY